MSEQTQEVETSLGHMPDGQWEFDESVAKCFDDMLERSIPSYRRMRELVRDVGSCFVRKNFDIVDLGASRGEAIYDFLKRFGAYNRYWCIEVSPAMLEVLQERFAGYIGSGMLEVRDLDLRTAYPPVKACLTLSVLTLQFTPIEHRLKILGNIHKATIEGGAFIMVEKVFGKTPPLDEIYQKIYYEFKHKNGYSYEEIDRKKLSLEGRLVPVSEEYNRDMLVSAGFSAVETFWRDTNFCAIVAIK